VPSGSRLLAGPDRSLPSGSLLAQNGGKAVQLPAAQDLRGRLAVWNAFFDLAPGQERTLTFDYELPIDLLEQMADGLVRYHLRVQKQPGTMAVPLAIQLSLPGDAQLVQETLTNPESWTQREPAGMGNTLLLSTDLRVDREVEVVFHAGHSRQ
jgi:hypothetical protein